jgi:medium-chain acyl-[acyl-carrier-protein] hydrolase
MNQWLVRQTNSNHRLRLFCFSYAGGNAAIYHPWQQAFDPRIEVCAVQLPGRGRRMGQAPYTQLSSLVKELAAVVTHEKQLPFAFFGHSLGALLAFEIARYCQLHHLPMPVHLFASGCNAPQKRNKSEGMHLMSDDDLIDKLKSYNGTPPEVLANRELMELVLPTIRADFGMAEDYHYRSALLLPTPITVLAGRKDDRSSQEQVQAWQLETKGHCEVHWFEGDHFFIHPENAAVRACVEAALSPLILR